MGKPVIRLIRNAAELQQAMLWLNARSEFPFTLTITQGEPKRSEAQNRLQFQWFKDAEDQGDQRSWEYRAYCKLHLGVPILRAENDDFCQQYDELIRPMPYEDKLALMLEPIDFPVTRLMSVRQKSRYLDAIWQHFTGLGITLTDPSLYGLEQGRY